MPQTQADVKWLADFGRVEIIDGDDVLIAPGITSRHAPGHTHGHNVLVLPGEGKRYFSVS